MRTGQAGFSLVEVVITLALVTGLYVAMMQGLGPALSFKSKIETESRLKNMRESLIMTYKDNLNEIDSVATQILTLKGAKTVAQALPSAEGFCGSDATSFTAIGQYLDVSPSRAHLDGFNQPMCFFITPQQTLTIDGVDLKFHSFALVSAGNNGVVDSGTTLSNDGILTLKGDDTGVLIDGRAFMQDRYRETLEALKTTAKAYQGYFQARYQADPSRSLSVDYFSCGAANCASASDAKWDVSGYMPSLGGGASGASAITSTASGVPHQLLGLSKADVTDGYGQPLFIQNTGDLTRNPANATVSMRAPPYTALVYSDIPGGTRLSQTIVGTP